MQVLRLVEPGFVDKIIAFDSLPERYWVNVKKRTCEGLPRHWKSYSPFHYLLEFKDINSDKERWQEIGNYVRKAVDIKFRLRDKLEDMAIKMAADATSPVAIEPEDIPVIPLPVEIDEEEVDTLHVVQPAKYEEAIASEEAPKPKRGRKPKVALEV